MRAKSHLTLCDSVKITAPHQAPLSMGLSRQEYWSGLPCPPRGDLPDPRRKTVSFMSPALAEGFLTINATWEAQDTGMGCHALLKGNLYPQ